MQRRFNTLQGRIGGSSALRALSGASVTVYQVGTTTKATLFSDAAGTISLSNPVTTNDDGEFSYYAANGRYDEAFAAAAGSNFTAETVSDSALLFDPSTDRVSVADYGATPGASAAVNTAAIAAAHAAALTVIYPPGVYAFSGGVTLRSGTKIIAHGATLRADSSFVASTAWFQNATQSSYTDTDIRIEGLTFDGNSIGQGGASRTRTIGMVRFVKVTGLTLSRCVFKNCGYIGTTLRSCKRLRVEGCEFTGLGWDGLTDHDGGYALWCASTAASEDPQDVEIIGNHFHDNYWGGMQLNGVGVVVKGNTFRSHNEGCIYSPTDPENSTYTARNHTIVGNVFDGVTLVDLSGNGIETCAHDSIISGNTILNCDERGIQVFGSQNLVISGNTIGRCGKRTAGTARSGIGLISNDGALGTPGTPASFRDRCENVQILGNRFYDNQGAPTMKYGVDATAAYNAKAAAYCVIAGNDFANVSWASSGSALTLPAASWAQANCTVGENIGAASLTWTPTVTPGTGAITTYSISNAYYQKVGNLVHFTASATISDNGTGATNLKFTLPPFLPTIPFVCSMWNSTQGRGSMGVWSSGSTITFTRPDTGAYPVATGDTVRVSGSYLVA